jgi:hypothetical protein
MEFKGTVVNVTDSLGQLLFYSNGAWIANRNHQQMLNGDSLNPSFYTNNNYVRGIDMQSQYLFTTQLDEDVFVPSTSPLGNAGINNEIAKQSTRNSIIKNFMSTNYLTETDVNSLKSTQSGTIQSSALVFNGPSFKTTEKPLNFVSYVYKELDKKIKLVKILKNIQYLFI